MAEKPQDEIRESAIKNDASELEKELLSAYKELNSTALTWLHLSDLQIKDDANNEMLDGLLADIEQVISKDKVYPDLIFVTGDIAFSGQESEYQLAEGFFERLLNITNIEENRLFLIPGNHDINWTEDPSNEYNVQFPTQESSGPLEIEYPMRGLRNFIDYSRRWLSPSGHPWFGQSVNSVLIKINGTNIKIVLIDTSWMGYVIPNSPLNPQEIDNIKYGLVSGVQDSYSPGFENAEYVITLLHHPVDSLQNELKKTSGSFDEKAINPLLEGSDFILHSHVNDNSSPGILSRDPIIINGGSLPGLIEHPNLYNWVLVDPITGDSNIKIRFFSQQDNSWTPFHTYPVLVSEKKPELDGPPLAGFTADIVDQQDQLGITPDVNAFSSVIASTEVEPPLCLGLFGDWGSGKTFFMDQMYRRIELLAKRAKAAEDSVDNNPGDEPLYHTNVVQIKFNAWHYIDTNLWASLVDHIYKEIAEYITPKGDGEKEQIAQKKAALYRETETAKQLLREAELDQKAEEDRVKQVEDELKIVHERKEDTKVRIQDIAKVTLDETLNANPDLKKEIDETIEDIIPEQLVESVDDIDTIARDLLSIKGAITASTKKKNWWLWWILAAIIVLITPFIGRWIKQLLSLPFLTTIHWGLVQVATVLGFIIKQIQPVISASKEIQRIRDEIETKASSRREQEEKTLCQELTTLQEKEAVAKEALFKAQVRLSEAEAAVDELTNMEDEGILIRYIQERVKSGEYESHLGIINLIHNDLRMMSDNLGKDKDTDSKYPKIDRIVLYIDDLDRCPEHVVLDVLQAVHLLLAFRLFVVVVGVDSRWLYRSLQKKYYAFQDLPNFKKGMTEEEENVWSSTPNEYLEKIFQIPYNLRPMDEKATRRLVKSIVGEERTPEKSDEITSIEGKEDSLPAVSDIAELIQVPADTDQQFSNELDQIEIVDLTPRSLIIEGREINYIQRLSAFLKTPRDVKRFINIYRLIRARLVGWKELDDFIGWDESRMEFRLVMTLLAIQMGFPDFARQIFQKLMNSQNPSWSSFIQELEPREITNEKRVFQNGFVSRIEPGELSAWNQLHKELRRLMEEELEFDPLPDLSSDLIHEWIPQVTKFSFGTGKIY